MLKDKEILPVCERYAKIFCKQATKANHIGPDAYNELFNEAFILAKGCKNLHAVPTALKWGLIKYIGNPCRSNANNPNEDKRKSSFLRKDSDKITALDILKKKEEQELLITAIGKLTTREQYIIEYYFYRNKNLKEIANRYDCSFQWISQLLTKILEKLRKEIDGL